MSTTQEVVGVDEYLGPGKSLFLGLQSVLACNLFLGPVVIIGATAMGIHDAARLIALTFLSCGLASILQSAFFLKYPIIQGMSFATIGAVLAIGAKSGPPTVAGAVIIASVVLALVGVFKIFSKVIRRLAPPIVAGTVIIVIGISLMPIVWNSLLNAPGAPSQNFLIAGISFAVLLLIMGLGNNLENRFGRVLRIGSVVWAMIIGTVVAALFGQVDFGPVAEASWFALPDLTANGWPTFEIGPALVMTFILLVVLVESLGSWFTVSVLANEEMSAKQLDRGVIGEALGCLLGGLTTTVPVTSYGSNAGVIAMTRVLSRWTAVGAGIICVLMALCPKLMNIIAIIPSNVVWGVFGVVTILILMSGVQSITPYPLTDRNAFVVGVPILAAIGTSLLPASLVAQMPSLLGYLCSSAIAVGAVVAIIMNVILPKHGKMLTEESAHRPDQRPMSPEILE